MMTTEDILSKLLLHNNNDWEIENVTCDDSTEEIHIMLKYRYDRRRFDMLENAEYQVSQAWKVKELFRDLLRLNYHGDMEAYGMLGDWMADALQYNIEEINGVVFMFNNTPLIFMLRQHRN